MNSNSLSNDKEIQIKTFVNNIFGGNAIEILKYRFPELFKKLDLLAKSFEILNIQPTLDNHEIMLQISKLCLDLSQILDKSASYEKINEKIEIMQSYTKKLDNEIRSSKSIEQNYDNYIDNLNSKMNKSKTNIFYMKQKSKECDQVLNEAGYHSSISEENIQAIKTKNNKLEDEVNRLKIKLAEIDLPELTNESLIDKISELKLELIKYDNFFMMNNY